MHRIVVVAWLASACTPHTAPAAASMPAVVSSTDHDVSGQWDGTCTPDGEATTIVGKLVVSPFGKGTDGARLMPDEDKPWVLTYRAPPAMRQVDGKRVSVRGRPCTKQGEAIVGRHFDADTLTEQ